MKHFDLVGRVDVRRILQSLAIHEAYGDPWAAAAIRSQHPGSPHADTQAIILRGPSEFTPSTVFTSLECVDWPITIITPDFADAIHRCARLAYSHPARAMIVKLKAGGIIRPHVDEGLYSSRTDRYHLCLSTNEQTSMTIGDETIFPQAEELWWFDKDAEHSCRNDGDTARLHLIVDCWRE